MNEEELKQEEKLEGGKQQFDADVLRSMINTGENQTGMVTVEPEDGIDPETDKPLFSKVEEKNKVKPGKIKQKLGKYVEKMLFDMKKNPEKYMIQTPRGMMSIQEALKQGYDPATKDFTDKGMKEEFEESLNALSESGRNRIKEITSPTNVQMPMSAAEGMGIDAEDEMVARPGAMVPGEEEQMQAMPQEGGPVVSPEMIAAMGGGQ